MSLTTWTATLCIAAGVALAQAPKPPFTKADAEAGKKIAATSLEIRAQIKDTAGPADPFKIAGNLYFVGSQTAKAIC